MAKISIGVPTYNGGSFIRECLNSIRNQTFEDFEVIISDNASNDQTSDVCAEYAAQDKRFKHYRLEQNIPVTANFLRVCELSTAPYFIWRADDDLADRDHLDGLFEALSNAPSAVLAVSAVDRLIGEAEELKTFPLPSALSPIRHVRLSQILQSCHPSWVYGLWRRANAIQALSFVQKNYPFLWAADHLAMLEAIIADGVVLSQKGKFIQRIKRPPTYHLPADQLLEARRTYKRLADDLIDQQVWSAEEIAHVRSAMREHINRRVAPFFKTYKRAIKQRVFSAFGKDAKP